MINKDAEFLDSTAKILHMEVNSDDEKEQLLQTIKEKLANASDSSTGREQVEKIQNMYAEILMLKNSITHIKNDLSQETLN